MKTLPFYWIDAFTDRKLGGNPCAVVLDADNLSDQQMLAIAFEMGLSETAFVLKSSRADFRAKYFTPDREIPLAGHPTIATVRALIDARKIASSDATKKISLELTAGVIEVEISFDRAAPLITMSQLAPEFLRTYSAQEALPCFGLQESDLIPDMPIQTVSTGSAMLMVPLSSIDAVKRAKMNASKYLELQKRGDFFGPHLFCLGGISKGQTFARHLGTPPDNPEDPFTGSATGCMAAFLWKYKLIKNPRFTADQGHGLGRPGEAQVEVVIHGNEIQTIRVGGRAVILVRGQLDL